MRGMSGWEDKDDLDLTSDDITAMMGKGEPVELTGPSGAPRSTGPIGLLVAVSMAGSGRTFVQGRGSNQSIASWTPGLVPHRLPPVSVSPRMAGGR